MKVKELFESTAESKIIFAPDDIKNGYFTFDFSNDIMDGAFLCTDEYDLKYLKGCPKEVTKFFNIHGCINLESLQNAPDKVGTWIDLRYCNKISSLEGIGKDYILDAQTLFVGSNVKSHILGILKIKNLITVTPQRIPENKELNMALTIIQKHLRSKNFNKCKSELKDAGLEEYAQL